MIKNATEIIEKGNDLIVDVISQHIELKTAGVVHKACCPFHDEKTPSFTVFQKTGTYKCFGCGQGGDSVQFLMDFKHLEFVEALEVLATITHISPDYSENRPEVIEAINEAKNKRQELSNAMDYVFAIYQKNGLPWKPWKKKGQDYKVIKLDEREYKVETVEKFKIAYAEKNLFSKLNDENLDPDALIEIGIIQKNESGHKYDFFTDRILFPIHTHTGKLVGFGGRILNEKHDGKRPKYKNSPASILYEKSKVLYGLFENMKIINGYDKAILVEGYTDVMSLFENNFPLGVAPCGTALSMDQAKLLKRFCKEVVIMRDGDEAGKKASRNDIDTLVSAGLSVKVCFLPGGYDPDSFAREFGPDGIQEIIDQAQDGIIWRIMEDWDEKDVFRQQTTYELASSILSSIDSEMLIDSYISKLAKDYMKGGSNVAKQLKTAIQEKHDRDLIKGKKSLTPEQASDVMKYGIYKQGNKYIRSMDSQHGTGIPISNFTIEPIMLIVAKQEQLRLMKVTNTLGQSFFIDMQSDVFVEFGPFKKVIEGRGDFLYNEYAKPEDHIKIKRLIYPKMPACYPIYTMGWHSKGGFWTWANGITVNGKFRKVDEFGIVEHEKVKYFLPYFSTLKANIFSDDDEDGSQDQTNFAFTSYPESVGFKDWTRLMVDVHHKNGMVAIAWMLSALFRDIIYKKMNSFPILNFFGPTRTGKSFLSWCLLYLFGGNPKGPFNINKGTNVALGRNFSWVRNGIACLDEFSENIAHDRFEFIKSVFDGLGREKGIGGFTHKTTRTPINSACLLIGEHQPTKSASLFARTISLDFPKIEKTEKWLKDADAINDVNVTGQLTQLTSMLTKFRDDVIEKFSANYDIIRGEFREHFKSYGLDFNDQVLSNYCVILSTCKIIMEKIEFAFTIEQLKMFCMDRIAAQTTEMGLQDEAAIFWKIISYLIEKQQPTLYNGIDILVKPSNKEKLKTGEWKSELPQKLVFLNFSRSIEEYNQAHQKSRNRPGLADGTIKYYLKNMDAFIGEQKSTRFGAKVLMSYLFYADKLPIDFPLSGEEEWSE